MQFCANDPDTLLAAARLAEPHCDAIDLNLGCPQHIARRGRYGAPCLQARWEALLHDVLPVPLSAPERRWLSARRARWRPARACRRGRALVFWRTCCARW